MSQRCKRVASRTFKDCVSMWACTAPKLPHHVPWYECAGLGASLQQMPQSRSQESQSSVGPQSPSPQVSGQMPQSPSQVTQLSAAPQSPSPHTSGHELQSTSHVEQLSDKPQVPSPHTSGQTPQSSGQLTQDSYGAQ